MPLADNLAIENAQVLFRNFAGMEKMFNSEGDRNFCVLLEPELAEDLKARGWNVKELRPLEEGDEPKPYIQVSVNYKKGRPPNVILITARGRLHLGADEVAMLDYADVKNWDIVLNPYAWNVQDNSGIKAYLKNAYITLNEDEFDLKYADVPDANPTRTTGQNSTVSEAVPA